MGLFDNFKKTDVRSLEHSNAPVSTYDFDGFLALEQMAEKCKAMQSFCRFYAPIGILDRFIEYEAKMRKQRKREAEERQRQIAQTILYSSWGLITAISLGGLSLLYFFTEFLRGLK